jgi:hypothetical protein
MMQQHLMQQKIRTIGPLTCELRTTNYSVNLLVPICITKKGLSDPKAVYHWNHIEMPERLR